MIYLIVGVILVISVFSSKLMYKLGIPTLIAFLAIGMLLGADGPGKIDFNDFQLSERIATVGLTFIIFYGGMSTSLDTAKPVAKQSTVLATLGVILTAGIMGVFAHFVLKISWLEGMLLGSIISSTDAASVFSILRSKNLNLKNNISSLLELESGSNDPIAYMLTAIFAGMIVGDKQNIGLLLLLQIGLGILLGYIIGKISVKIINKINIDIEGLYSILLVGLILVSYSATTILKGNGLLAVYITGMVIGNSKIMYKNSLVKYFDGLSWLMQISLFLTLGLLVYPSKLPGIAKEGILVAMFITFVARPIVVFVILSFYKRDFKEKLLVSWVGFRGAASIVFAITPMAMGIGVGERIFNIIFFTAIVSLLLQGTLFVPIAHKLDLVADSDGTKLKTFTDHTGEIEAEVLELEVYDESNIIGKTIMELDLPDNVLIMGIKREDKLVIARGNTIIREKDIFILGGKRQTLMKMTEKYRVKLSES